jgi:dolichyl-phosphate mannosyltransferase polypeptide 3
LWALVSFGAYLLGTLGWNIFTFQDKEEAYRSLLKVYYPKQDGGLRLILQEIDEAKEDLRAKGVTVD